MSLENAKAFLNKLDNDKEFLNQVAGADDTPARTELARTAGFDFTDDELGQAINELHGEELSEEDLDSVAGGVKSFTVDPKLDHLSNHYKRLSLNYAEVEWTY
jgi:predicted ribosomally synthesized peptide with nif11-like leader